MMMLLSPPYVPYVPFKPQRSRGGEVASLFRSFRVICGLDWDSSEPSAYCWAACEVKAK